MADDTERAIRVRDAIPSDAVAVAESGIKSPHDASVLHRAGYDAVLVGESLVTNRDRAGAVSALIDAAQG